MEVSFIAEKTLRKLVVPSKYHSNYGDCKIVTFHNKKSLIVIKGVFVKFDISERTVHSNMWKMEILPHGPVLLSM